MYLKLKIRKIFLQGIYYLTFILFVLTGAA